MAKLTRPWSVQIELVEGCNRMCPFCGINGIRDGVGNYKYMLVDLARNIASQCADFCPDARYEFAMHGEPTMHPEYLKIIRGFREALPKTQLQITTNGKIFMKSLAWMQKKVGELFDAGIDFIIMDTYYPERDKLRKMASKLHNIPVLDFYDQLVPMKWSPWHNHRRKHDPLLILMDDLMKRNGEVASRIIYNHAGNASPSIAPPLDHQLTKTCTLPFREIAIRWDGSVALCCHDWANEFMVGHTGVETMAEIWMNNRFEVGRKFLANKMRHFSPCIRCDIGSGSRSGLLPKYPVPSQKDYDLVWDVLECSPHENDYWGEVIE